MGNFFGSMISVVALIVSLSIPAAQAYCSQVSNNANCTASAFRANVVPLGCLATDGVATKVGCITDPCSSSTPCAIGSGCSITPTGCVTSQLLCWSLGASSCGARSYCKWITGATAADSYCNFTAPSIAPATAAANAAANTCPAVHPALLGILIAMLVTLIVAIGVVIAVVFVNRRKQEEIDREEEEAEAEAAVGRL